MNIKYAYYFIRLIILNYVLDIALNIAYVKLFGRHIFCPVGKKVKLYPFTDYD